MTIPANQSTIEAVNGGQLILITRRECWYFSHRNKLLRRGVSISTASFRAVRVAGYIERRWPEAELKAAEHIETYNDSPPEMWGYPDPFGGAYTEDDQGYGFCPNCGSALFNWGAGSDGDGDIYDEWGCDHCREYSRKVHADFCLCPDCIDRNL